MKDDSHVLIGTRIELDKDKVEREGRYDYSALIKRLDYICEHFGLDVLESGHLYGNKKEMMYHEADIASTKAMYYLGKCEWFVENVKIWQISFGYAQGDDRVWNNALASYDKHLRGKEMYVE